MISGQLDAPPGVRRVVWEQTETFTNGREGTHTLSLVMAKKWVHAWYYTHHSQVEHSNTLGVDTVRLDLAWRVRLSLVSGANLFHATTGPRLFLLFLS